MGRKIYFKFDDFLFLLVDIIGKFGLLIVLLNRFQDIFFNWIIIIGVEYEKGKWFVFDD